MVESRRHSEIGEDQDEYKDVVNTESLLDQISCEKLQPILLSKCTENPDTEERRQYYPDEAPDGRFPGNQFVTIYIQFYHY
jgi:hypothetical protein